MAVVNASDYRLYLVTDPELHRGFSVLEQVELALAGGVRVIQIREKEASARAFLSLAAKALEAIQSYNATLIINDRVDIALAAGAQGVHLGQEDMPVALARRLLGDRAVIGVSVKTVPEALEAAGEGADYLVVNGIFPTGTKTDLGYLPGLSGIREIRPHTRLPLLGIGGINPDNCADVIAAGADGVAVVTAITMAEDIPAACRRLLAKLHSDPADQRS